MPGPSNVRTRHAAEDRAVSPRDREGGWGIVVVIAAHLSMTIQSGLLGSFGVLYLGWKEEFDTNDKYTAAVLGIFSSLASFSGPLGGVLTRRFGSRVSGMVGGVLMSLGLLCSYWVTGIYQLYATVSIVGVGTGVCFNSAVVAVAVHFKKKYKTANSVAYPGNGTGLMSAPPLLQLLQERYGWRGAFLIASAIVANTVAFSALFRANRARRHSKPERSVRVNRQPRSLTDIQGAVSRTFSDDDPNNSGESCHGGAYELEPMHAAHGTTLNQRTDIPRTVQAKNDDSKNVLAKSAAFLGLHLFAKSYRFALICIVHAQYCVALMMFVVYLVPRAQSVGVSPSSAAVLLSVLGIGSFFGRLGNGLLVSWKISAEHVAAICMVLAGVSLLLLILESYPIFAIASFLHGFVSGCFAATLIVLVRSFIGLRNLSVGYGLEQVFVGVGTLIGPVFAGWILDTSVDHGAASYPTVFCVGSTMQFLCAIQMLVLPLPRRVEPGFDIGPTDA